MVSLQVVSTLLTVTLYINPFASGIPKVLLSHITGLFSSHYKFLCQ